MSWCDLFGDIIPICRECGKQEILSQGRRLTDRDSKPAPLLSGDWSPQLETQYLTVSQRRETDNGNFKDLFLLGNCVTVITRRSGKYVWHTRIVRTEQTRKFLEIIG
jgi:hypothetical protein